MHKFESRGFAQAKNPHTMKKRLYDVEKIFSFSKWILRDKEINKST